jgi:3-hydroxyisobutyrate dehydrogenase-like beta-hydroxyacid dehydrogenase
MPARAFFIDLNSASPSAKQRAGARIDAAGGRYVESAVMTSIPPYRIRVPMRLGGAHAQTVAPALAGLGFDVTVAADRLGVASATKMCRSVMIKGLEALVIESLVSARAYGVEDAVLASLAESFPEIDWERQATYFFQRVIQHGRRRAEEMREVALTVSDIGLEPFLAGATARRQDWVADLAAAGRLGARDDPRTDWRHDADRMLAGLRPGPGAPPADD